MGKKRKYSSEILLNCVIEYLEQKADIQKIAYRDVVEYCHRTHPELCGIYYQCFSRDPTVSGYVEKYNSSLEKRLMDMDQNEAVVQEIYFDARDLYDSPKNDIERTVAKMNAHLAKVYASQRGTMAAIYKKTREIKGLYQKISEIESEKEALAQKERTLREQKKEVINQNRELNKKMKRIREHIERMCTAAMMEHWKELGLFKEDCVDSGHEELILPIGTLEDVVSSEVLTSSETKTLEKLFKL